jgi:signal transduction histidine kinase
MRDQPVASRRVRISTSVTDSLSVEVKVADTGKGIDPDALDRIFEPFYSTKPDGMGMGLSISRSIIESHGGSMRAQNVPGGGAEFSFVLKMGGHGNKE